MKYLNSIFTLLMLGGSVANLSAQDVFTNDKNVALNGYDVLAYFNQHEAVKLNHSR